MRSLPRGGVVRLLTGSGFAVCHHAAILLLPSLGWEAFLWPLSSMQGGLDRPVSQKRLSLQDHKSKGTGFAQEAQEPTWGGGEFNDKQCHPARSRGLGRFGSQLFSGARLPPWAPDSFSAKAEARTSISTGTGSTARCLPPAASAASGERPVGRHGCPPQPAVLLLPIVLGQAWPWAGAGAARALWKRGKHLQTQPGFHSRHCCPTLKPNPDQRLPNTFLSLATTPELAMQPHLGFLI